MLNRDIDISLLKKKLGDALSKQSFPINITSEERKFLQTLLDIEKTTPIDCSINPTEQYLTVREIESVMWGKLTHIHNLHPVVCECCKKEKAQELHEVWTYKVADDTCYKTLTSIRRLCRKCHTLCHTVRYINKCKTGEDFVSSKAIRSVKEGYKGAEYYRKMHSEMHAVCPVLSTEEWNTLHMVKNCISNFYRRSYKNFELNIDYFYDYFRKVEKEND